VTGPVEYGSLRDIQRDRRPGGATSESWENRLLNGLRGNHFPIFGETPGKMRTEPITPDRETQLMKFSREPKLAREPRLSEQVADFLAAEIDLGTIRPGESLPSEAELSYRFNVSRAVIREALARLKQLRVLESRQGSRTRVARGPKQSFGFTTGGKESLTQEIASLYELKILLEGDAAALAAMRRSDRDIKSLQSCLDALTLAMREGLDGANANFDFHQSLIEASGNRYLIDLMKYVNERLWDFLAEDESQPSNLALTRSSLDEHVRLFEAVLERDPERARRALHLHLENAAKRRGIEISTSPSSDTTAEQAVQSP
jgi:GntR family transcriptional repressor for pyruvate dehydrogenase complex